MSGKVLWIAPKWTFPINDGARVATDRLLGQFVRAGAKTDLLCLALGDEAIDETEARKRWGVENIFIARRMLPKQFWKKAIYYVCRFLSNPSAPLTMSSFLDPLTAANAREIVQKGDYDWVVLDGLHLGACFVEDGVFINPNPNSKFLYRAHNIEQHLWEGKAQGKGTLAQKLFLRLQHKAVASMEEIIVNGCDLIAPISEEDHNWMRQRFPDRPSLFTPLALNFDHPLGLSFKETVNFLFLGRLDWPPNREGLEWFLEEVWPQLERADARLTIAGSGDGGWLKKKALPANVEFHGYVDDVDTLYQECDATIAPIFFGSGTRIKVVESIAKGRAVITTSMGAQGSGLRPETDYIQAETASEWLACLESFCPVQGDRLAKQAREKLRAQFDEKQVALSLLAKMELSQTANC